MLSAVPHLNACITTEETSSPHLVLSADHRSHRFSISSSWQLVLVAQLRHSFAANMSVDDKLAVPTQKQRRPFIHLSPALAQLVEDRFDEDQYDQAVDLLDQLNVDGIRPSKSLIQKLIALSLCSLAPGQVASTSRWTLDHQLQEIAARLLTHSKSSKNNRDAMKAASSASERPSQSAVLKATSLILGHCTSSKSSDGCERSESLLARYVLEALPSRRKPLEAPQSDSSVSPRRPNRASPRSDESQEDGSLECSSIERWVRADLHRAEDIWDLLCHQRFSNSDESDDVSLNRVSEFWMNESERKRYQRQLQISASSQQRLEDRLRELQRKNGSGIHSSDSDEDGSSDDADLPGYRISGRSLKRTLKSTRQRQADSSPSKPAKRARPSKPVPLHRDDAETPNRQVRMTEGAWRTLAVLLVLWQRSSVLATAAKSGTDEETADGSPLLWQFPRGDTTRSTSRGRARVANGSNTTDEIGRALDVAFSFPNVLPGYAPPSTMAEATTDLFDVSKSIQIRGDVRSISSVPQAELRHRQLLTHHKEERDMATRAETASQLLLSIHELVEQKWISSAAFMEGISDRLGSLRAHELHHLMLPILDIQPSLVATVLSTYLRDATRIHPDHQRTVPQSSLRIRSKKNAEVDSVHVALAFAIPREEKASVYLANARDEDRDANSVLDFLSMHKLELDSSIDSSFPLAVPTRSESRKRSVVQVQKQKSIKSESQRTGKAPNKADSKSAETAAPTEEMKKGGFAAFAYVRTMQMEARVRINQIKFLLARALATTHLSAKLKTETGPSSQEEDQSLNGTATVRAQQEQEQKRESGSATMGHVLALDEFLSELSKALDQDASEFKECVSAMRSHISKDSSSRRQHSAFKQGASSGSKVDPSPLPSFETMVDRCQRCHDAAQNLADSTRLLKDYVL